jgi:choline dehydrogenase
MIDPKYFSKPSDLADLVAAVKLTREIFQQEAFDQYRGPEVIPGAQFKTDKEIGEWVKSACETAYHPSCSNKMGKVS